MFSLLVLSLASAVFACSEKDLKHCVKEHEKSFETLRKVTRYYKEKLDAIAYCKDSRPALECLQGLVDGCRNDKFVKMVHLLHLLCKDSVLREYNKCFANATAWFSTKLEKGTGSRKECASFERAVRLAHSFATADCGGSVASEIKDFVVTWYALNVHYNVCDVDVEAIFASIPNASEGTTSNHQESSTNGKNSNNRNHQSILTVSLFLLLLLV